MIVSGDTLASLIMVLSEAGTSSFLLNVTAETLEVLHGRYRAPIDFSSYTIGR